MYYGTYAIQWSLYFKTTHWTMEIWFYIAVGLKIKVHQKQRCTLDRIMWSNERGSLKIKSCKLEA